MKFLRLLLFLGCIEVIVSCDVGTVEPDYSGFGYDYYPYDSGQYLIYRITVKDEGLDTTLENNYFLKEVYGDSYESFGQEIINVSQYKKTNWDDDWDLDSIATLRPSKINLVKVESDVAKVKLIFPIENASTWDGNAQNASSEDEYEYSSFATAYSVDTLSFENTVTVIQEDVGENLIKVDSRYEVYAKGVGLIKRYSEVTEKQPGESTLGRTFTQEIVSYGN